MKSYVQNLSKMLRVEKFNLWEFDTDFAGNGEITL